jgi:hypothetical protein
MTLGNKKLPYVKESKLPSAHTNPMTFGRNLRVVDRVYHGSDRDTHAFLRKMMLMRMNEAKAMLGSSRYTLGEKRIIRSNKLALENMWSTWKDETAVYEL